jgi:GMP synthase-like glutamine amidotransferase
MGYGFTDSWHLFWDAANLWQIWRQSSQWINREYGKARLQLVNQDPLWHGIDSESQVWMSHADQVESLPSGFISIAATEGSQFAAFKHHILPIYALQFHPEVHHSVLGKRYWPISYFG